MIAKLQSPVFAAILALGLSAAVGVAVSWQALVPLLAKVAVVDPKKVPETLKQKGWDFWTIEIDNLSAELQGERARLRKESELLDQRAARLNAEEKELGKVRASIEVLRKEIAVFL